MTPEGIEVLKGLASSGPFGVAFYFIGKEILKAWKEDRAQLQATGPQLAKNNALLERVEDLLERRGERP